MAASPCCWESTSSWEGKLICISKYFTGLAYFSANSDICLLSKIVIYQQKNLHMMNKSHYIMGQLMHFKCMELAKWNWWAIIEQLDSQVIYHWKPQRVKFISNLLLSNYKTAKFYHKKRTTFSTSYNNLISISIYL